MKRRQVNKSNQYKGQLDYLRVRIGFYEAYQIFPERWFIPCMYCQGYRTYHL
jgi:hypothetical protein